LLLRKVPSFSVVVFPCVLWVSQARFWVSAMIEPILMLLTRCFTCFRISDA
jgi:hypothetical protein